MSEVHEKIMEAREMALNAAADAKLALTQIATHEKICSERYQQIINGINDVGEGVKANRTTTWWLVTTVGGAIIVGLIWIILEMIKNGGHL